MQRSNTTTPTYSTPGELGISIATDIQNEGLDEEQPQQSTISKLPTDHQPTAAVDSPTPPAGLLDNYTPRLQELFDVRVDEAPGWRYIEVLHELIKGVGCICSLKSSPENTANAAIPIQPMPKRYNLCTVSIGVARFSGNENSAW